MKKIITKIFNQREKQHGSLRMGPYCKFCNNRCFITTTKDDIVSTDLKATCGEGIKFDLEQENIKRAKEEKND